ncbi:uncharacterized protein LOC135829026 [Sycon ciliatum]|uniref:uncharacterized protein LOC135829026 n=1 Tax=Sycon ciliatum TaxID=27933 RepID=UPI0031F66955
MSGIATLRSDNWFKACCSLVEIDAVSDLKEQLALGFPEFESSHLKHLHVLGRSYKCSELSVQAGLLLIAIHNASVTCLEYLLSQVTDADLNRRYHLNSASVQETPLHYAIRKHHNTIVDLLLSKNVSLTKLNSLQQTPLDFCMLEAPGCLPNLLQHIDQLEYTKKVTKLLKESVDKTKGRASRHATGLVEKSWLYRVLGCGEQSFIYDVSLTVVGAPGSGKTTLVESMATSRWTLKHGDKKAAAWSDEDGKRTRGMAVGSFKMDGMTMRCVELPGNNAFSPAYCLFARQTTTDVPSIAIVVCSCMQSRTQVALELKHSFSMLATLSRRNPAEDQRLLTFTIFSRADLASMSERENGTLVHQEVKADYASLLNLQEPFFVNTLKAWDTDMCFFRVAFSEAITRAVGMSAFHPAVLEKLRSALPKIRSILKSPISSKTQFIRAFMTHMKYVDCLVEPDDIQHMLQDALDILASCHEVILFEHEGLKRTIVNEPSWFLTDILGTLCSPPHYPPPRVAFNSSGSAPLSHAMSVFGVDIVEVLIRLRLCAVDRSTIMLPPRLKQPVSGSSLVGGWVKDDDLSRHTGCLFVCDTRTPFASGLPTQVQIAVRAQFHEKFGIECTMLRDTVEARAFGSATLGCVTFHPGLLEASVIVRGEADREAAMHSLMAILRQTLLELTAVFSPGSIVAEYVLSSQSIAEHIRTGQRPLSFTHYATDDVVSCLVGNKPLTPLGAQPPAADNALDLLHLPSDHLHLLSTEGKAALVDALSELSDAGDLLRKLACKPTPETGDDSSSNKQIAEEILDQVKTSQGYCATTSWMLDQLRDNTEDWKDVIQVLKTEQKKSREGSGNEFEEDNRHRRRYMDVQTDMLSTASSDSGATADAADDAPDGSSQHGNLREFDLSSLADIKSFATALTQLLSEAERDQLARCVVTDILDESTNYRKVITEHMTQNADTCGSAGPVSADNIDGILSFWMRESVCLPPTSLHLVYFIEESTFSVATRQACHQLIATAKLKT